MPIRSRMPKLMKPHLFPGSFVIAFLAAAALSAPPVQAQVLTWGNTGTDFATNANWGGGTAPADNLTTNIGLFSGTAANQPNLAAGRDIGGLQFDSSGWTMAGSAISIGSSNLVGNFTTGTVTFNNQLRLGGTIVTRTVSAATGGTVGLGSTLNLNGNTAQKTGAGTLRFTRSGTGGVFSGVDSSGTLDLNSGTLRVSNTSHNMGSGQTFRVSGSSTLQADASARLNVAGAFDLTSGTLAIGSGAASSQGLRLAGSITAAGGTGITVNSGNNFLEIDTAGGSQAFAGNLHNSGGFTKNGTNTLTLGGTYGGSGTVLINDGFLEFARATGTTTTASAISGGGGIIKSAAGGLVLQAANVYTGPTRITGGTLSLGVNNAISNSSNLELGAGTFAISTFTDTVGTLDMIGSGTLTLGPGGAIAFADSSAVDWGINTIAIAGNFTDAFSVRFGGASSGLTSSQLSAITINGFGATIDSSGYLSAIPEPSACAMLLGGAAALAFLRRKRKGA